MAYPSSINTIAPGFAPWDEASMLTRFAQRKLSSTSYAYNVTDSADIGSKGVARIGNSGVSGIGSSSIPDFAEVYSFIGSVFDPDTGGHVQKLKEMDPINFETVLLLMRNLTVNLCSPDFEPIRKVLSSYDISTKTVGAAGGIIPHSQMDISC
ncbi:transcription factor ASG4-like protein [Corchorus olitorius]|uniref:Transcription factor ASG4-like protein n=1 Tax=Corchorus olitorius TaxID=93759 RepID=A0A1R3HSV1_9ROSI|nr:transcription factor ASG4-like protein [Corchorus olitorius]